VSDPAVLPPIKPADDGLLAALQPLGRHAVVSIASAEIADAAPKHPAQVLVAEDHPAPRRGFLELLDAQADLRVIAAVSSAEEALATAERERIDVALVDYKLGDHDGLWVSRELKRLSRPPQVVLCCEFPNGVPAAAAVIAEADALVSKRATGAELCQTIRSTLDGRSLLPMIPSAVAGLMRQVFDGEEQAVLAMMLAGISRGRISSRLGVSSAGLDLRLARGDAPQAWDSAMTRMIITPALSLYREPARSNSPGPLPGRRDTELCRGAGSPDRRRSSVRPMWPGHAGPFGRERASAERHISGAQSKGDSRP
jgi:DNA-binding NarL/FixJ family response regulator